MCRCKRVVRDMRTEARGWNDAKKEPQAGVLYKLKKAKK